MRAWLLVAAWSIVIFLTIPFARAIQRVFNNVLGPHLYLTASAIVGVFFAGVVLVYIFRQPKTRVGSRLTWLVVLGAASVWVMRNQLQTPAEAIHFFEYGILSFLLFRAWSHRIRDWLIYPISAVSLVLVASFDEFIQWMMPGRYWDFRDIRLNLMAGVIIQCFIALVIHPPGIAPGFSRRSVRWMCRLSLLTLLLFGFAISNTPARVDLYATRIPFLRFLSNNESVMSEFGYRHADPEIGVFFSRFPVAEIIRIDRERGTEAGEIVLRYKAFADYREFLQTFTSSVDPFLHEMRVHLNRRDHYYSASWKHRESDPARFTYHMTVAMRENLILEKYFSNTLEASGTRWGDDKYEEMNEFGDVTMGYVSAVSDHLVTRATEMELWFAMAVLGGLLGWCYRRYGREPPRVTVRPMIFNEQPRGRAAVSWMWVGGWVLFIYLTIPFARAVQEIVRDRGGKALFLWVTFLAFALAAGYMVRAVVRRQWSGNLWQWTVLVAILGTFSWMTWSLRANPEEAFHFVQYGVLSLLLFRALSHRLSDPSIYYAAAMMGFAFGIFDELIQWATPRRYFDYRDILINVIATGLVQVALAAGIRPAFVRGKISGAGIRLTCRATVVNGLLLLFCLSNTPRLKDFYTRYVPAAASIKEVTAEYGHEIVAPGIGVFFSRLAPDELKRQDRERGRDAAEIINRVRTDRQYFRFLQQTPVYQDPLTAEARIHIFRRDRHAAEALRQKDPDQARAYAHVAYSENQILSIYFPHTFTNSIFQWSEDRRQRMEVLSEGAPLYRSAVSRQVITRMTQWQWSVILLAVMALAVAGDRWAARRERS